MLPPPRIPLKIHVFYRHYNTEGSDNKNRPKWFSYEKCFVNFLRSIEGKNVNLHLIMDGDAENDFVKRYKNQYTLHTINAKSDQISFWETWKIAGQTSIGENDLIYFVENDYLHVNNWVDKVVDLFSVHKNLDYVSLYDHNDKYFLPMYQNLMSKVFTSKSHHWRVTPSACGSFIVNKRVFNEDFTEQTTLKGDHDKFLFLKNKKNRSVVTPIPGLSTHCMNGLLSPVIEWEKVI